MVTAGEIIAYVEGMLERAIGSDEGVHFGSARTPVERVMVCWMATPDALDAAIRANSELVIGHESLYFPYNAAVQADNPPGWENWRVNRQRRDLLATGEMTFLRLHFSLDELYILDDFAEQLELGKPVQCEGFARVYEIEECTLGELIERAKKATGMSRLRVAMYRGMEDKVRRIGLPLGGLGLFVNVGFQQQLVELGCDAFIAGESDEYGFHFAIECGIPMIETSHAVSENRGLRRFSQALVKQFPQLDVQFHENRCPWECL